MIGSPSQQLGRPPPARDGCHGAHHDARDESDGSRQRPNDEKKMERPGAEETASWGRTGPVRLPFGSLGGGCHRR